MELNIEDYRGKAVVVTGACGGVGASLARAFAVAGAALGLCDVQAETLARFCDELSRSGTHIYSHSTDVTDERQVREFCDATASSLGGIDSLVNTVGIVDNMGDVEQLPLATWDKTLAVNLTSAFLMAKGAVPHMKSRGGGSIINISSISAFANQEGVMVYSVSKAGLLALTKSEAIDLAKHNIRANSICPGSIETPMLEEAAALMAKKTGLTPEEQLRVWSSQYPTRRFSKPRDIAEIALFLSSDRASNITGANFVVDGGIMAVLPER